MTNGRETVLVKSMQLSYSSHLIENVRLITISFVHFASIHRIEYDFLHGKLFVELSAFCVCLFVGFLAYRLCFILIEIKPAQKGVSENI